MNTLKEWIILLAVLTCFIAIPISCSIGVGKDRTKCLAQESIIKEYPLVSLFDYENVSKKSSLSGGFFVMMGAVSGQSVSELKYYIRYAYEDAQGVKLMTEEIGNDSLIRIKEVKNAQPKLIVKHEKKFTTYIGEEGQCRDIETFRIFEIPEGSFYKTFEMDMK